jgi:hypothetical protein
VSWTSEQDDSMEELREHNDSRQALNTQREAHVAIIFI